MRFTASSTDMYPFCFDRLGTTLSRTKAMPPPTGRDRRRAD
jgi:hypothetical protein